MGIYKELDIVFQDIVHELAETWDYGKAETQIWSEIGSVNRDLADQLVDTVGYEAVLVSIEQGKIPHNNLYWQMLVIRTAYNMIADIDEFVYICEHSRFSQEQVQQMIDYAVGAVLSNPKFNIEAFSTRSQIRQIKTILETV